MNAFHFFIIFLFLVTSASSQTINGSLPTTQENPLMDIYSIDLDGDGTDELVATSLNIKNRKLPSAIKVFKLYEQGKFQDKTTDFFKVIPKLFHARHLLFIPDFSAGLPALFISDHGADFAPFEGAISKLFVLDKKSHKYLDQTHQYGLDHNKGFTFASTYNHTGVNKRALLVKANMLAVPENAMRVKIIDGRKVTMRQKMLGPMSQFEIQELSAKNQFKNIIDAFDQFPANKCFMNALFADFDGDQEDELVIGGCDLTQKSERYIDHDLILKKKQGKLVAWISLPKRNDEDLWGVAALYARDLFKSKRNDLVEVIYNNKFTKGKVNIFENVEGQKFKLNQQFTPDIKDADFFIPWVVLIDINNDHQLDIIGTYRFLQEGKPYKKDGDTFFVLKNTGKTFIQEKMTFQIPRGSLMINAVKMKIKNREHLAFIDVNGKIYIIDPSNK